MTLKKKISRRRFSDDFKRRVVAEASQPDTSWSEVALRYELNTNLLFKWKEKFEADVNFLPVELATSNTHTPATNEVVDCIEHEVREEKFNSDTPLEILLPCGSQLRCGKGTDPRVLSQALTVLRQIA